LIPYKDIDECWAKLPALVAKESVLIAVVDDQYAPTTVIYAAVALVSVHECDDENLA
jgi:hypothetical protein